MLRTTGTSAILITLGLSVWLAGCASEAAVTPTAPLTPTASAAATSNVATRPSPSSTSQRERVATKAAKLFVCPNGGVKEAADQQRSVNAGHQPWWLSPKDVAAACTFGIPDATVKALGAERYRVTQTSTGKQVFVSETQPGSTGSTGIWVVTKLTPPS